MHSALSERDELAQALAASDADLREATAKAAALEAERARLASSLADIKSSSASEREAARSRALEAERHAQQVQPRDCLLDCASTSLLSDRVSSSPFLR